MPPLPSSDWTLARCRQYGALGSHHGAQQWCRAQSGSRTSPMPFIWWWGQNCGHHCSALSSWFIESQHFLLQTIMFPSSVDGPGIFERGGAGTTTSTIEVAEPHAPYLPPSTGVGRPYHGSSLWGLEKSPWLLLPQRGLKEESNCAIAAPRDLPLPCLSVSYSG